MNFPDKLRKLRKENNLTQEDVASKIFVSRTLITKYENRTVNPTKENLEKLALLFNVKLDYLLDEEDTIEITLKNKEIIDKINFVIEVIALVVALIFILFAFLPVLSVKYYDYSFGAPPAVRFTNESLLYLTLKHSNPIALVTIILLGCNIFLIIYTFIKKKERTPYIYLIIYIFIVINIFLIFFSIVFGISYCSNNLYDSSI